LSWDVQQRADEAAVQVPRIALVLRLGPEAGDAASLVVGVEVQVQADGAPSSAMGCSMPHTKHMRELGCFSMMSAFLLWDLFSAGIIA
jgi:hypothetical protein